MPPRSGATTGYSSWPPWDGPAPVPRVKGIKANLVPAWDFQGRNGPFPTTMRAQDAGPMPRRQLMRFYTNEHRFYCGVDLHARILAVCILDGQGQIVFQGQLAARPDAFLQAVTPYRDGLVVACECMFAWQAATRSTARPRRWAPCRLDWDPPSTICC